MKGLKRIFSFVVVLCMCFNLFSFYVYADSDTYAIYNANECYFYWINTSQRSLKTSTDVRSTIIRKGSNYYKYLVSDSTFIYYNYNTDNSCSVSATGSNASTITYNGQTYYFSWFQDSSYDNTAPVNVIGASDSYDQMAIYYTYGDGAIGPEPGINWGKPALVEYSTKIAGSGTASGNNIDRISWDPDLDSNTNLLPSTAKIQIRAIPGEYTGITRQDLLTKTYTDLVLNYTDATTLVTLPVSVGRYETKWVDVANQLSLPFASVQSIIQGNDYFYKTGWIYQIRLIIEDEEYESDWINIYTATGSGVQESEVIVNSDDMTQELIQNILVINTLNENTTTNWMIQDITINMNEYTEPGEGDKPWWAYLLEAILSVFNIDDNSQQIINLTNENNNSLEIKLREYNAIEDQQLVNLDNSLENIDVESDLISNNKFIQSANWVTQQYNRMTSGTVIGSLIGFSLLFGLALIFIGKIK